MTVSETTTGRARRPGPSFLTAAAAAAVVVAGAAPALAQEDRPAAPGPEPIEASEDTLAAVLEGDALVITFAPPELPDGTRVTCRAFLEDWSVGPSKQAWVESGKAVARLNLDGRPFAAGAYRVEVFFFIKRQKRAIQESIAKAGLEVGEGGRAVWAREVDIGSMGAREDELASTKIHYRDLIGEIAVLIDEVVDAYGSTTKARFVEDPSSPTKAEQVAWAEWIRDEALELLGQNPQSDEAIKRARRWLAETRFFSERRLNLEAWNEWLETVVTQLRELEARQEKFVAGWALPPRPRAANDTLGLIAGVKSLIARAHIDVRTLAGEKVSVRGASGLDSEHTVKDLYEQVRQVVAGVETALELPLTYGPVVAPRAGSAAGRKPR